MFWKKVFGLDRLKMIMVALGTISCFNALPAEAATLNVPSTQYPTIQSAIDAARLGDTIVVEAGRTYTENLVLKYKSAGTGWITIQSSKLNQLPAPGNRVSPSDAVNMPRLTSTSVNESVIRTQSGANPTHHYRLVGLEVARPSGSGTNYSLIMLGTDGSDQNALSEEPSFFEIDRSYIHGTDGLSSRRGIGISARNVVITNSYISKFFEQGADTQAILGWNTSGQIQIINNYLEATGENIMFGGVTISLPNTVPTDILIEHNHFHKPLSWKGNEPGDVKNLLEFKNGKNVIVRYNIFENMWAHSQDGSAILFTPRNDGSGSHMAVQNITFEFNIMKNVGGVFQAFSSDYSAPTQPIKNININNNLVISSGTLNGNQGRVLMMSEGGGGNAESINFNHNTFVMGGSGYRRIQMDDRPIMPNFKFDNNIVATPSGTFDGIYAAPGQGTAALNYVSSSWTFNKNAMQLNNGSYPNSSLYLSSINGFGFVNSSAGNFELSQTSPYRNAGTDGKDIGADIRTLNERTACVQSGKRSDCGAVSAPTSAIFDFDGDGKADVSVFRPEDSVWYVQRSAEGSMGMRWGLPTDQIAPADFDGDGKTDIAVFRANESRWYIFNSSTSSLNVAVFGTTGDIPVQADYDGDGISDVALWRPSNGSWYSLNSSNGGYNEIRFGMAGDRPAVGDYDGDGRADQAIYRPSTGQWYLQRSTAGFAVYNFGIASDIVTPADFDGDGKTDIAVFRPATGVWYQLGSINGQMTAFHFGMTGDIPSPADYDGDGRSDIAVFRPSTGIWYMQNSTSGFAAQRYGLSGDIPIASVRSM